MLDKDDDGKISKTELSKGLRMVNMDQDLGRSAEEMAQEMIDKVDVDGDGFISIEEWEASMHDAAFNEQVSYAASELDVNVVQLRDILQYVFVQWDTNNDGKISYEEFQVACGLMGMNMSPTAMRQTFLSLSGGKEYIFEQKSGSANVLMSSMQSALFEQVQKDGFSQATYIWNTVRSAWGKSELPLPDRLQKVFEAFCSQSDILPDLTETLSDLVGIGFAVLSISNQLSCLPDCREDGVDWMNLIPVVVLLRRTFMDSFKKVQDTMVRDLDQEKALVFTTTFKPAGFSVVDFEQLYEQGQAEWRTLTKGMKVNSKSLGDKLQVIVRGSMKILNQSVVPGLSETSVVLGPGTFLGAADFMKNSEGSFEQNIDQYISVMEDTLVLIWEGPSLRRYFQVNGSVKQQFQVMLARSIESTMWQVSEQAQKMAVELPLLFRDFLLQVRLKFRADRATLWVYDGQKDMLWTLFVTEEGKSSYVSIDARKGLAGSCFEQASSINIPDCYQDDRFNMAVDKQTGYYTKSTLCVPVFEDSSDKTTKPIGVVQLVNKLVDEDFLPAGHAKGECLADSFTHFSEADEQNARRALWLTSLMIQQLSHRYNAD